MITDSVLYKRFKDLTYSELNQKFEMACVNGHLHIVEYLLESAELDKRPEFDYQKGLPLNNACYNGNLEVVQYLLNCKNMEDYPEEYFQSAFDMACSGGSLDVVKYFYNNKSPYVKNKPRIYKESQSGLEHAATEGHFEIVRYLTTCAEIEEKPKSSIEYENAFKAAYYYKRTDLVKFFIFDLNIEKTPSLEDYFNKHGLKDKDEILDMFKLRDLKNNLEDELQNNPHNETSTRKPKI